MELSTVRSDISLIQNVVGDSFAWNM